jgi:hypothetical protein
MAEATPAINAAEVWGERQIFMIDGAAGPLCTTRQQRPLAMAHTATAKRCNPSPHHGGPLENGPRNGVGAIAAVGTKAP